MTFGYEYRNENDIVALDGDLNSFKLLSQFPVSVPSPGTFTQGRFNYSSSWNPSTDAGPDGIPYVENCQVFIQPDVYGARLRRFQHPYPTGAGADVYTRHSYMVEADQSFKVRVYHDQLSRIRNSPSPSFPFFSPINPGYGLQLFDAAGLKIFDTDEYPLIYSHFETIVTPSPGSYVQINYQPLGRMPWILMNSMYDALSLSFSNLNQYIQVISDGSIRLYTTNVATAGDAAGYLFNVGII